MRVYKKHQIIHFLKNAFYSILIAFLISMFAHLITEKKIEMIDTVLSSIKIFFSILPLVFLSQKNFLFRDGPLKAIFLVFYYLVLVPIINLSLKIDNNEALNYLFILLTFINIFLLIVSHIIILKYVFSDFLRRKRKVVPSDVIVVITTYVTMAISFGLFYTVLSLSTTTPVFHGISRELPEIEFYFKHIYFSFITITTVGYGDIYPLTTFSQFVVVVEIITGLLLTNVILGLVIGSGILVSKD